MFTSYKQKLKSVPKFEIYLVRYFFSATEKTHFYKNGWRGVVGLEVHAQINTASKLFSGAAVKFGASVNSCVSLFDAAIPGTLPVLNRECVEAGILTSLALSCKVNPLSWFDRKHYFYSDLPAGYQITQQRAPLANNGIINFHVCTTDAKMKPYAKSSVIHQIQLEQDSGKSLHDDIMQSSLVDLNRAGIPLMEFVFAPDLSNGEEAAALVKELCLILTRLGTCLCKMEEGGLRVDVNVSVNQEGGPLGIRSEVKNIGSVRGVAKAVDYEIIRQCKILESGKNVTNETRAWDPQNGVTVAMRDKEENQDYRFMPEPNLPPLRLNMSKNKIPGLISVLELYKKIPELPDETRSRLQNKYGLPLSSVIVLVNEDRLLELFEQIMVDNQKRSSKIVANILTMELLALVNTEVTDLNHRQFTKENLGEVVDLLEKRKINRLTVKRVLQELVTENQLSPMKIVDKFDWSLISDPEAIKQICLDCYSRNPKLVAQYNKGNIKVFGAFLGDIAAITDKKADMELVSKIMKEILDSKKKS